MVGLGMAATLIGPSVDDRNRNRFRWPSTDDCHRLPLGNDDVISVSALGPAPFDDVIVFFYILLRQTKKNKDSMVRFRFDGWRNKLFFCF